MNSVDAYIERLRAEIYEELRPFGQYLAMRKALPSEQRFGVPEAIFAVMTLIVWAVTKYAGAYISERGKLAATKSDKKYEDRLRRIEIMLEQLQKEQHILRHRPYPYIGEDMDQRERLVLVPNDETPYDMAHVGAIELLIKSILKQIVRDPTFATNFSIEESELVDELRFLGLSERAARTAASRIAAVLTDRMTDFLR